MSKLVFESGCRLIETEDGQIGIALIVYPFESEDQAAECAEFIREPVHEMLRTFFEAEGHGEMRSVPTVINGNKLS